MNTNEPTVTVAPTIHVQDAPAYGDTFTEAVIEAMAADATHLGARPFAMCVAIEVQS